MADVALNVDQGADFSVIVTYLQADGTTPIDITGYSAEMQIRHTVADPAALLELDDGAGITIDGPLGKLTIALTAVQTMALPAADCVYDLFIQAPSAGLTTRLIGGDVLITPAVTRDELP